jgi:hypothetical protein
MSPKNTNVTNGNNALVLGRMNGGLHRSLPHHSRSPVQRDAFAEFPRDREGHERKSTSMRRPEQM